MDWAALIAAVAGIVLWLLERRGRKSLEKKVSETSSRSSARISHTRKLLHEGKATDVASELDSLCDDIDLLRVHQKSGTKR